MKRNSITFFFLICIAVASYGQNGDLKWYTDLLNDFEGYAAATLLKSAEEATSNFDIDQLKIEKEDLANAIFEGADLYFSSLELVPLKRVTKNNAWLLNKAVEEWEYFPGDIFYGTCVDSRSSNEGIIGIALIGENGKKIWRYYYVKNGDALEKKIKEMGKSSDNLIDRLAEKIKEKIATGVLELIPQDIKEEFSLNSTEDLLNLIESIEE